MRLQTIGSISWIFRNINLNESVATPGHFFQETRVLHHWIIMEFLSKSVESLQLEELRIWSSFQQNHLEDDAGLIWIESPNNLFVHDNFSNRHFMSDFMDSKGLNKLPVRLTSEWDNHSIGQSASNLNHLKNDGLLSSIHHEAILIALQLRMPSSRSARQARAAEPKQLRCDWTFWDDLSRNNGEFEAAKKRGTWPTTVILRTG